MALRLAGTSFLAIQGTDNQGWVREVTSLDALPGLKVDQQGTGRVFDFQDGGVSRMFMENGGNMMIGVTVHPVPILGRFIFGMAVQAPLILVMHGE